MIFGFQGLAGAGKSLAAAYLAERHGFARVRFADPLKAMLRAFYISLEMPAEETERRIEGDLKEAADLHLSGQTPRRAMQRLGTDWGRDLVGPHLWTDAWLVRTDRALLWAPHVVAEDCRFANEADTVRAQGGAVIEIVRPGAAAARSGAAGHVSEVMDFAPDVTIRNDGTPAVLFARLDGLARRYAPARAA